MTYEEAKKLDAYEIQKLGYDVGEDCAECIDRYGRPSCHAEEEMDECGRLDDLHQMLVGEEEK